MKRKNILMIVMTLFAFTLAIVFQISTGWAEDVSETTKTAVKTTIQKNIDENTNQHNGLYLLKDAKGIKQLKFDYIHKGVHKKGEKYLACVDFTDKDNNSYDVDFYVEGSKVVDVVLHKEKGKKQ